MNVAHRAVHFDMTAAEFVWFAFLMAAFLVVIGLVSLHLFVPELFVTDIESAADFGAGSIIALGSSSAAMFLLSRV